MVNVGKYTIHGLFGYVARVLTSRERGNKNPPNGKFGKSSTQKCRNGWGHYGFVPRRVNFHDFHSA